MCSTGTPPWSAISAAACLALLAYGESHAIQSQASQWSCHIRVVDVNRLDVQVLLVRSATEAWVAYRGTQPDKLEIFSMTLIAPMKPVCGIARFTAVFVMR